MILSAATAVILSAVSFDDMVSATPCGSDAAASAIDKEEVVKFMVNVLLDEEAMVTLLLVVLSIASIDIAVVGVTASEYEDFVDVMLNATTVPVLF